MTDPVYETEGHWTFITPIAGLELMDAVKKEFRVDRVLFVAADKLPRIRKRLGLHQPVSAIKSPQTYAKFFEESKTFAVVRQKGKTAEIRSKCFRLVRDELAILALSQLGYRKISYRICRSKRRDYPRRHKSYVLEQGEPFEEPST